MNVGFLEVIFNECIYLLEYSCIMILCRDWLKICFSYFHYLLSRSSEFSKFVSFW